MAVAAARQWRAAAQIRQTWPSTSDDALSKIACALASTRPREPYQKDGEVGEWPELAGDEEDDRGEVVPCGELAVEEEELRRHLGKLRGALGMLHAPGIELSSTATETGKTSTLAAEKI